METGKSVSGMSGTTKVSNKLSRIIEDGLETIE